MISTFAFKSKTILLQQLTTTTHTTALCLQLSIAILKELPRADRPQQLSNVLLGLALLRYVPAIRDFWSAIWQALDRVVLAEQKVPDAQVGRRHQGLGMAW